MEIKIQIPEDIGKHIDAEELRGCIESDVSAAIIGQIRDIVMSDKSVKSLVREIIVKKAESIVAKRVVDAIDETDVGTINYSWGLADRVKEMFEEKKPEFETLINTHISNAVSRVRFSDYEIKSLLRDVVLAEINAKNMVLSTGRIVQDFIEERLAEHVEDRVGDC